ncbi:MAG: hypothetical protein ACC652_14995, partial [Acidimicrobiales bacterium]
MGNIYAPDYYQSLLGYLSNRPPWHGGAGFCLAPRDVPESPVMTRFFRYALGLSIVTVLVPVLAVALPGVLGEQTSPMAEELGPQVRERALPAARDEAAEPGQASSGLL